jgi:RNA polymerase sigma-B factor
VNAPACITPSPVGQVHRPVETSIRPPSQRSEYEHLVPLFADHARLPDGHPDRARLRRDLIAGYQPVARNIARKFGRRGENADDLEQVATVGLILAVDRFDPGRGVDFLSFAVPTMTGEVQRYFRDRFTPIRLPRRLRQVQAQIYTAAAELAQRNGRAARPSEIAQHLGVEIGIVLEGIAAQNVAYTSSLDEPRDSDGSGGPADQSRLAAALGRTEPEFDLIEHRETLGPLLVALPERERRILLLRFFGGKTQTEIAVEIGISQMHVSRLLSRTLAELRRQMSGG